MGVFDRVMQQELKNNVGGVDYKRGFDDGKKEGYEQGYKDAMNKFKPKDFYDRDQEF